MEEQRLPGGKTWGAVRIADTVHRPTQSWTPAVHAVLRYLETVGFDGAPQVLGFDKRGREILTYLSGETIGDRHPWPAWAHSEAALTQVGVWARRLHDATATFVPPQGVTWFVAQTWQPGLVVGHHDAAPYNAVWRDGRLVGFVDWDTAGPSSREVDLAFVALSWVPLHPCRVVERQGFTAFDDRSRRLHLLLDAYGYSGDRSAFGAAVAARARVNAAGIHRLAAGGDPMYVALLPVAADFEQAAREVEALPASFWLHPGRSRYRRGPV
jgi:Phosphotransferase enzyme family